MRLYRIVYAKTVDDVPAASQRSYLDWLVDRWLENNCQHAYYNNPGWTTTKFIEFESETDAVNFALKWAR